MTDDNNKHAIWAFCLQALITAAADGSSLPLVAPNKIVSFFAEVIWSTERSAAIFVWFIRSLLKE